MPAAKAYSILGAELDIASHVGVSFLDLLRIVPSLITMLAP
jgi:hypothetical protein